MDDCKLLIKLLDNVIFGGESVKISDCDIDVRALLRLAKRHDLIHLLYDALVGNGLFNKDERISKSLIQEKLFAVCRDLRSVSVAEIIKDVFQNNGIKFILLKGAIIKKFYPESWMRTSCDIDVLVKESDLKAAVKVLKREGFTTDGGKNYHDISFYYGNVHVELHFNILENIKSIDGLLGKVWDYSVAVKGVEYAELPEFFAFHHIAHMAYHFLSGGCGVRPFIDLRLMQIKGFYDDNKLIPLLNECGLSEFYKGICEILEVWFNGKEHNENTRIIEDYVIDGGVYGSAENNDRIGSIKHKGKVRYLLSIVFLPYKSMCVLYPSLKNRKILLPFYYIHRIFSKTFGKGRRKAKNQAWNILSINGDKIDKTGAMLKYLGLDIKDKGKVKSI